MAVTKIWAVKDNLKRLVDYAENPEKTANPDAALCEVIEYAADNGKTEQRYYITGVNCAEGIACEQMTITKQRYGKEGGAVAYHAYQSFRPNEVTPELCHQIGVELARRLWGDRFEVLVATHLNTNCCHNHFVINSVSFSDGKKYNGCRATYRAFREASDTICREHGLSVIERPAGRNTPRKIYQDEKAGKDTRYNIVRDDVRAAVLMSWTWRNFTDVMQSMGYEFGVTKKGFLTVKPQGWKYPIRLDTLGEAYTREGIIRAIMGNYDRQRVRPLPRFTRMSIRFRGKLSQAKGVTGLRALYYHFLYRLGVIPKGRQHKPYSVEMRHELLRLDKYIEQIRLLTVHRIGTVEELSAFMEDCRSQMEVLSKARSHIDNRRRRCDDPQRKEEYSAERSRISAQIGALRKEAKAAEGILGNTERMKELIRIEEEQISKHDKSRVKKGRSKHQERTENKSAR